MLIFNQQKEKKKYIAGLYCTVYKRIMAPQACWEFNYLFYCFCI